MLPKTEASATERQLALVTQIMERSGVLTREMVNYEFVPGGFAAIYPVLKALEEAGKLRRGYFVAGLGAAQFAVPGAEDRLREFAQLPTPDSDRQHFVLAATDPANPYGAALPWPNSCDEAVRLQRAAGALVVIDHGQLLGYLNRTRQQLVTFLPDSEPDRTQAKLDLAAILAEQAEQTPLLITHVDGCRSQESPMAEALRHAGFFALSRGMLHRGNRS